MIHVQLSAQGLGDSVCGLYAACGMAATVAEGVTYHCRHVNYAGDGWLNGWSSPNLTVVAHNDKAVSDLGAADMNADYDGQLRGAVGRKQWYINQAVAATHRGHGAVPARPVQTASVASEDSAVVLAPFSAWHSREWPAVHWAKLAWLLSDAGYRVSAIDSHRHDRLRDVFGTVPNLSWHWGMSPQWVVGKISSARAVIANDSGVSHLGGLFNVPTLAIMSHLNPALVFDATSVEGVAPDSSCARCAWQTGRGWRPACDSVGCSALASVSPDTVFRRMENRLKTQH